MPAYEAFFLVGPTAVGKSAVAQYLAEKLDYEVLSADSMLVYTGMDIGTAKPTAEDMSRVRYHGINLTTPDRTLSVWDYVVRGRRILAENAAGGRKTMVVGGTGLYVKSLTDGLFSGAAPDPDVRATWISVLEENGVESLQSALKARSPALYEALDDKRNARRLIRALELAEQGIEAVPHTWKDNGPSVPLTGLHLPIEQLKAKIESRVARVFELGLVNEVRGLLDRYGELSPTARQAIGYKEAIDVVKGRCLVQEAITRTVTRTCRLAKRQRTWFRHQANVRWIDIQIDMRSERVADLVLDQWRKYGPTRIAV